ncbi:MAG: metallophosphoesterase family protein [candidate division Zixibacteria bacterium]
MKVALISDIHGNLEALEAVLADIEKKQVEAVYCLGDVIGYGSQPSLCLATVKSSCDILLMGNHEYYALGLVDDSCLSAVAQNSAKWTQEQLNDHDMEILADLPMNSQLADIELVHASPHGPEEWHYILGKNEAEKAFEAMSGKICFHGHTHLPAIFGIAPDNSICQQIGHDFLPDRDNRYLVNIGSVGQPRDHDPRASYVTFDSDEWEIDFHRVEYDISATQKKMRAAGLPDLLVERLVEGH